MPNRGEVPLGVLLLLLVPRFPKLKPVLPPLDGAALAVPPPPPNKVCEPAGLDAALSDPKIEGLAAAEPPAVGVAPKGEAAAPPLADEAPTFPKRPPPELGVELFWLDPNALPDVPKRPPLGAPLDAGAPKEKDMAKRSRDQGNWQAWWVGKK